MSKFKGTRGPWTLETVRTSSGLCHKVGPFPWKGKQNHACVYDDYPGERGGTPELVANAALIAQAPAMLQALQALIQCGAPMLAMDTETFPHLRGDWVRASETANSILAALRAAGAIE